MERVCRDRREHHPLEEAFGVNRYRPREGDRSVRPTAADEVPVVPGRVDPRLAPTGAVPIGHGQAQPGESVGRERLETLDDDLTVELEREVVRSVATFPGAVPGTEPEGQIVVLHTCPYVR